jgi:hypothetical protein
MEKVRMRRLFTLVLILILCFAIVTIPEIDIVKASTNVTGIISLDTTWTKASSPYNITGDITINCNITLTIESGVTVNFNDYSIIVNGSLNARGTRIEPIYFNSPNPDSNQIIFTRYSESWNEETGTGSIIENTVVSSNIFINSNAISQESLPVYHVSPLINNNSIHSIRYLHGAPIISNNTISEISIYAGQPKILHNNITNTDFGSFRIMGGAPEIYYNTIACGIQERGYYYPDLEQTISHNTIYGGGIDIDIRNDGGTVTISNNYVSGSGFGVAFKVIGTPSMIVNNTITGTNDIGILVSLSETSIVSNVIYGCTTGILSRANVTIKQNTIFDNTINGIEINNAESIIENNTIEDVNIGIFLNSSQSTIHYNNIQNSKQNNIYLSNVSSDIDATYNWWGITSIQEINLTIFDNKNDSNLGKVNFVPFLTELNPEIPEFPSWVTLPLFVVATLVVIFYRNRLRRKVKI